METKLHRSTHGKHSAPGLVMALVLALFAFGNQAAFAQDPSPTATPAQEPSPTVAPSPEADAPKVPNDQLDALVAPIALYPDPLLSQVLVASTYPLELVQLQQWLTKTGAFLNPKAVIEAVQKEDWDPSIQAMAPLPEVVKQLADNIRWTSDLGNAFLAQQSDVMSAIQRMRTKAKDGGKLASNDKMKVETQQVEDKTFVVIEQADPEVVYVPSYNPTVVWGAMPYPYPYMYYPPYGYYGGAYIGYGLGLAVGIAWGGGGWGWGAGWGNNDITINRNNNFNRNTNINGGNRVNPLGSGNNSWRHNPQHRGAAPYPNRDTASRFGGAARGDSLANRQNSARQNLGRTSAGTLDRSNIGGGGRDIGGSLANRPSAGSMDRGGLGDGNRGSMGGERIGSRDVSRGSGSLDSGSFGRSSSMGGGAARSSSSRGSSSMGSGGFGGRSGGFGGGMRGGGMRGGGGRR